MIDKRSEILDELTALLQPGRKLRIDFGENKSGNGAIHIRSIVDNECVIFEKKTDGKQEWEHYTETYDYFRKMHDAGYLKKT